MHTTTSHCLVSLVWLTALVAPLLTAGCDDAGRPAEPGGPPETQAAPGSESRADTGDPGDAREGGWIELFNGKDLDGWQGTAPPEKNAWQTAVKVVPDPATADEDHQLFVVTPGEGILVNGTKGKTCNLFTEMTHGDCEAHIEFMVPKGSNSGVYFMGRYEIQILDSFGKEEVTFSDCGGIYARWINNQNVDGHAPRVNASKAPGQWQTYDVIFRAPEFDADGETITNARFVKVVHNGKVVHENVELKGPTRSAMRGPAQAHGPLMLQGDHGPVAYRNLRIRPLD